VNDALKNHIESESTKRNVCKVQLRGTELEYEDGHGHALLVSCLSTGETFVTITDERKELLCTLSSRAAHELRDFLNRRFPNATAVQ
jgi:hypothetical protein